MSDFITIAREYFDDPQRFQAVKEDPMALADVDRMFDEIENEIGPNKTELNKLRKYYDAEYDTVYYGEEPSDNDEDILNSLAAHLAVIDSCLYAVDYLPMKESTGTTDFIQVAREYFDDPWRFQSIKADPMALADADKMFDQIEDETGPNKSELNKLWHWLFQQYGELSDYMSTNKDYSEENIADRESLAAKIAAVDSCLYAVDYLPKLKNITEGKKQKVFNIRFSAIYDTSEMEMSSTGIKRELEKYTNLELDQITEQAAEYLDGHFDIRGGVEPYFDHGEEYGPSKMKCTCDLTCDVSSFITSEDIQAMIDAFNTSFEPYADWGSEYTFQYLGEILNESTFTPKREVPSILYEDYIDDYSTEEGFVASVSNSKAIFIDALETKFGPLEQDMKQLIKDMYDMELTELHNDFEFDEITEELLYDMLNSFLEDCFEFTESIINDPVQFEIAKELYSTIDRAKRGDTEYLKIWGGFYQQLVKKAEAEGLEVSHGYRIRFFETKEDEIDEFLKFVQTDNCSYKEAYDATMTSLYTLFTRGLDSSEPESRMVENASRTSLNPFVDAMYNGNYDFLDFDKEDFVKACSDIIGGTVLQVMGTLKASKEFIKDYFSESLEDLWEDYAKDLIDGKELISLLGDLTEEAKEFAQNTATDGHENINKKVRQALFDAIDKQSAEPMSVVIEALGYRAEQEGYIVPAGYEEEFYNRDFDHLDIDLHDWRTYDRFTLDELTEYALNDYYQIFVSELETK